jgi:hypothetical protein
MTAEFHESLWLRLDADMHRALAEIARQRGISQHQAARFLMRLGLEAVQRARASR